MFGAGLDLFYCEFSIILRYIYLHVSPPFQYEPSSISSFETTMLHQKYTLPPLLLAAPSATVSAAGVGWGMGGRAASSIAPREARQLQAEMAKKQQIWKVRKTFGLEPTPMADRSAQVEELGAGAWQ